MLTMLQLKPMEYTCIYIVIKKKSTKCVFLNKYGTQNQ